MEKQPKAYVYICGGTSMGREVQKLLTDLHVSEGGKTWPRGMLVHDGPSAYSSMRVSPNGRALHLLYERGETPNAFFASKVVFERIRLDSADSPIGDGAPAQTSAAATTPTVPILFFSRALFLLSLLRCLLFERSPCFRWSSTARAV